MAARPSETRLRLSHHSAATHRISHLFSKETCTPLPLESRTTEQPHAARGRLTYASLNDCLREMELRSILGEIIPGNHALNQKTVVHLYLKLVAYIKVSIKLKPSKLRIAIRVYFDSFFKITRGRFKR